MDPRSNPYRPGAGRRPPVLAGRERLLDDFDVVRARAETLGEGDRGWILDGLRGVGKTVLLGELHDSVSERGWITAKIEAGEGTSLPVALSRTLTRSMRTATGRHPIPVLRRLLGVVRAFSLNVDPSGTLSLGVQVDAVPGVADTGMLADDLAGLLDVLGETSRQLGVGTLLLIDELQEALPSEQAALNTAIHQVGQAGVPLPVMVVGAGLPSLPAQLAEATSYAERLYVYRPIGLLEDDAAAKALLAPAAGLGVAWQPAALAEALAAARGYPYLLQAVGKHVWDYAKGSPIDVDDVQAGLASARREVDNGLYRSRWERATPAQQVLLRAVAELVGDGSAPVGDLARAAGRTRPSDISVARNELIKKGLLYAPERGRLAFTVPGMADFVTRQP